MNKKIFKKFSEIIGNSVLKIGKVLEVGVTKEKTLLDIHFLREWDRIGINIDKSEKNKAHLFTHANANKLSMFKDKKFDLVLCNAVLEHDQYFWKSISEMKRVLKVGGLLIINVPSYSSIQFDKYLRFNPTYRFHAAPNDYYRFSKEAVRGFFDGFREINTELLLFPPRCIGWGYKQ